MNPHIFRQVDRQTWIAVLALIVGWFFSATLVTSLGSIKQKYHFFDMLTVMLNPPWLIYGMGSSHVGDSILFGVLCTLVLVGPIVPFAVKKRSAWLLCVAPLILMLAVGFELYAKTSGPYFEATQRAGSFAHALVRWGNAIAQGTGNLVARHISVGFGAYLSLAASLYLAAKGLRTFRAGAPRSSRPRGSSWEKRSA
jgi:hypothetical protein